MTMRPIMQARQSVTTAFLAPHPSCIYHPVFPFPPKTKTIRTKNRNMWRRTVSLAKAWYLYNSCENGLKPTAMGEWMWLGLRTSLVDCKMDIIDALMFPSD